MNNEEIILDPWCLTLPAEYADERDFKAEEAIKIDTTVKLPESFSLGQWIYKTGNQWALGACTAMWTTHWVQILKVRQNWVKPTTKNIITPSWKDLRTKMGHSTTKYDGWDYVERAINVALKEWIYIEENWEIAKFDGYATSSWSCDDKSIDTMKRYLYQWDPIVRCVRWDQKMWSEMSSGEVKTVPENTTWWHCIALVGWDKSGMRFINSWSANDANKLKSRFHISYDIMKKIWLKFNFRYWVLYIKEDQNKSTQYMKHKNNALIILKALKNIYAYESEPIQREIIDLSRSLRSKYPELNNELPVK